MRKSFEVHEGRIQGLRVIGFHGEVDASQTPARREPLFADAEGRIVGLEEGARVEAGTQSVRAVWGQVARRGRDGALPGLATPLEQSDEAHWEHLIVVLGKSELRHLKHLMAAKTDDRAPRVDALLAWLTDPENQASTELRAQRVGEAVAWYCSPVEAFVLYQRISRVAEEEMMRASLARDDQALYQASWWLGRAAMEDSDRYIAAVGLELGDRRMAEAYLKATFRKRPGQEIEAGLSHARGVFSARCRRMEAPGASPTRVDASNIGSLVKPLNSVRNRFVVRGKQAA